MLFISTLIGNNFFITRLWFFFKITINIIEGEMLMKKIESLLLILAVGSLWGFFEVIVFEAARPIGVSIHTGILCALGVLFLVFGRRLLNVVGTSLAIGLVVCFLKTYSVSFQSCQWAGVLSLAIAFDVFASYVWRKSWWTAKGTAILGAVSVFVALPMFVISMKYITHNVFWINGWTRVMDYSLQTTGLAIVLCLFTAPLGYLMAQNFKSWSAKAGKLATGFYAATVVLVWMTATVIIVL